jgi:hypothetical protein|uniref:AP2/ERF domain-containing protein n=1 Tax=viral metagenome TaxID=1070528 RepID=A0A6C0AN14_9ZZZZ
MKQILLSSKNKDIREYTLVSDEDYDHLKQFKWHKGYGNYIYSTINNKKWLLHRYIMIELICNKKLTRHNFIDHINNNRIDNSRENLRIVTATENNRNKLKAKNTSSKYIGVSFHNKKWRTELRYNSEYMYATYNTEEECAYQWDLWMKEYNIITAKLNNIPKPDNFIKYIKLQKLNNLPKYIYKSNKNKFRIIFKNYKEYFYSLEEAEKRLNEVKNIIVPNIILPQIIIRNENNDCIIELFNKKKEKIGETIVDEENYNDLMKYRWYINRGYVHGIVDSKNIRLHRYVLNYNGKDVVDHINNNPLDNRKCNLRIVTSKQNSMNKKSSKNSTSEYIGVSWDKTRNKWKTSITINNKEKFLGRFNNEIDAAKCRDIATIKYYGEYGNLNFPIF